MDQNEESPASLSRRRPSSQHHSGTEFTSEDRHPAQSPSIISNDGTGDNWQIMVSTNDKGLHGTNKGRGWRNRQLGGNLSDSSVKQISADMVKIGLQQGGTGSQAAQSNEASSANVDKEDVRASEFETRHGPGLALDETPPRGGSPA